MWCVVCAQLHKSSCTGALPVPDGWLYMCKDESGEAGSATKTASGARTPPSTQPSAPTPQLQAVQAKPTERLTLDTRWSVELVPKRCMRVLHSTEPLLSSVTHV